MENTSAGRPNIVLIMADDLGYETLACNGGESYLTPNLDRLAERGTRFTHAYATPLCTPSRVQLMTGKYNFRNYHSFGLLDPAEKTFANYLQSAGYRTAIAGKWQLGGNEGTPAHFGFDEYLLWQLYTGDYWYRYKNPKLNLNGTPLPETVTVGKYGPDLFSDFLLDFIGRNQDAPFLVYYPMVLTHDPFQPTPRQATFSDFPFESLNDTTYFAGMVAYMDATVGKIVAGLDSLGLMDNTVVIFTGDNGTSRKVVSRFKGGLLQGDKGYTTEAGTHVPLIVAGPNPQWAGQVNDDLVDFTDMLPTLLGLGGMPPGSVATDGRSFIPGLEKRIGAENPREWVYCYYEPKWASYVNKEYAQNKRYKLYATGEFFDIVADPMEQSPKQVADLGEGAKRQYEQLRQVLEGMR